MNHCVASVPSSSLPGPLAEAVAKAEVRLVARNNEILATRKTDEAGHVLFEAGLARGEGGLSPALLTVTSEKSDYAFLSQIGRASCRERVSLVV